MNEMIELTKIDYVSVLPAAVAILAGTKAILSLLESFVEKLGLETKWMRQRREEHELLIQTSQNLTALQTQHEHDMQKSDRRDEEISADIKKLTRMFVDKEIDDMRWEINNFATKVSDGKPCNKDSFQHCIHTWEKYEKLLSDHGMENGEVELSMELVKDAYRKKMKEGF